MVAAYLFERKNLPDKKCWSLIGALYTAATLAYMVPLWHYEEYVMPNVFIVRRTFSLGDAIIFSLGFNALLRQWLMGFTLTFLLFIQRGYKLKFAKVDYCDYSAISKIFFVISHFSGAYFMQGFLEDLCDSPFYRKLHNTSGVIFFVSMVIYVLATDYVRKKNEVIKEA